MSDQVFKWSVMGLLVFCLGLLLFKECPQVTTRIDKPSDYVYRTELIDSSSVPHQLDTWEKENREIVAMSFDFSDEKNGAMFLCVTRRHKSLEEIPSLWK